MIGNEKIKSLWRERFKGKETVLWRSFFDVFPSQARDSCGLSAEDIKVRCLMTGITKHWMVLHYAGVAGVTPTLLLRSMRCLASLPCPSPLAWRARFSWASPPPPQPASPPSISSLPPPSGFGRRARWQGEPEQVHPGMRPGGRSDRQCCRDDQSLPPRRGASGAGEGAKRAGRLHPSLPPIALKYLSCSTTCGSFTPPLASLIDQARQQGYGAHSPPPSYPHTHPRSAASRPRLQGEATTTRCHRCQRFCSAGRRMCRRPSRASRRVAAAAWWWWSGSRGRASWPSPHRHSRACTMGARRWAGCGTAACRVPAPRTKCAAGWSAACPRCERAWIPHSPNHSPSDAHPPKHSHSEALTLRTHSPYGSLTFPTSHPPTLS